MAKEIINLRNELRSHKFQFDLLQKIPCSAQENKKYQDILKAGGTLPEGIFAYVSANGEEFTTQFYTIYETDLTEAEIQEYLTYKQLSLIRTIKNCVVFFTALTVTGMIVAFFLVASALS